MLFSAFVMITTAFAADTCDGNNGIFGFGAICVGKCDDIILNSVKDMPTIEKIMRHVPSYAPYHEFNRFRFGPEFEYLKVRGQMIGSRVCTSTWLQCSCEIDWSKSWVWIENEPDIDAPKCGRKKGRSLSDHECAEFAQGKPTKQSSTGFNGDSTLAVNGDTNRNYDAGPGCTHTLHQANTGRRNEWWRVDLQDEVAITSVQIWNRDSFKERINGATIRVGMTDDVNSSRLCANIHSISTDKVFQCLETGRYVFIVGAAGQYLTLCEVKVFGTSTHGTPVKPSACDLVRGGMWERVRHVPAGNKWHAARDSLHGTVAYGNKNTDSQAWSVTWDNSKVSEFMFATGDCEKWLVASRDAVVGEYYHNEPREILQSSTSNHPYYAKWYRRSGAKGDPWISLEDYSNAVNNGNILYGGNSHGGIRATKVLPHHKGADVYIRHAVELARGKPTDQSSTGWGGLSDYAVDGNTGTNCDIHRCAHTYDGVTGWPEEWWRVDLEAESSITSVQIWNRDSFGYRINGAQIKVGSSSNHLYATTCAIIDSIPEGGNKVFDCGETGRYVFVVAVPRQYVTLSEVKVFGVQQDNVDILRWLRDQELRRLEAEEPEAEEGSVLERLAAAETEATSDATTLQLP